MLQDHRGHRTILVTHDYMNFDELRHDPLAYITSFETAGYDYGLINDPEGANDGETIWRELVREYPNISMVFNGHIFGDGTTQLVSYSDYDTPVYQILDNYQDGVAREITGNGNPELGDRGGNGAIRLVTIDPTENQITYKTFFVALDEDIIDFRQKPELDRDGLTGSYIGHEIVFEDVELGTPEILPQAEAGDDLFVTTEGEVAGVTLDGGDSFSPDDELSYQWQNEAGNVIAEGETANVSLPIGKYPLTLTVENKDGVIDTDEV